MEIINGFEMYGHPNKTPLNYIGRLVWTSQAVYRGHLLRLSTSDREEVVPVILYILYLSAFLNQFLMIIEVFSMWVKFVLTNLYCAFKPYAQFELDKNSS